MFRAAGGGHEYREAAYKFKEHLALELKPENYITGKIACVAVQASPHRRALFAAAGKFTSAFTTLSGDPMLETKRERSLSPIAFRHAMSGNTRHLHMQQPRKGSGKNVAAASGRWVRVSEYNNGSLAIFDGECATFGVGATTLTEAPGDTLTGSRSLRSRCSAECMRSGRRERVPTRMREEGTELATNVRKCSVSHAHEALTGILQPGQKRMRIEREDVVMF